MQAHELLATGHCHAHNVGVSLLAAVGQAGWVARDMEHYVELAVKAAKDLPALSELRQGLRERMLGSAFCDGPAFVRQLEGVYAEMWREQHRGRAQRHTQGNGPVKSSLR